MLIMQSKRIKLSSSEHSKSCAMQNTSMQKTKKKLTEYRQHKLLLISFKTYFKIEKMLIIQNFKMNII